MEFEENEDHPLRLASINGHEDGRSVQVYDQAVGGDIATRAEYYHKDHLGNVRLSFSDLNQDGALTVRSIYDPTNEILLEKSYYPCLTSRTAGRPSVWSRRGHGLRR